MTTRKLLTIYGVTGLVISIPFTVIHLLANPDDAPISPAQHLTAAVGNFLGPWGVAVMPLVDFPNAGLRPFSWTMALGLTVFGALLLLLATRTTRPGVQLILATCWGLFAILWFGVGLSQIASGLL